MQLNCVITSWLVVTYDKIMTLKKIITTYLDVTNDCILLGAVVATIDFILFGQLSIPSSIDSTDVNHYANASISHYDCLSRQDIWQHLQHLQQNATECHLKLIPQLSINLTMLLLSSITNYPVESGLTSIFQDKKGENK